MSVGILLNDLARMAQQGPVDLGARVDLSGQLLAEQNFRDTHDGLSPQQWEARRDVFAREAFEQQVLGDLEGDFAGKTPRERFAAWSSKLADERRKLALIEDHRDELQRLVDAPKASEGVLAGMLRRTVDGLLGKGAEESDANALAAAEHERLLGEHRAKAAAIAIAELEPQAEYFRLRIKRLEERRTWFESPALWAAARPIVEAKLRAEAQAAALGRLLDALPPMPYGVDLPEVERPARVTIRWGRTWADVSRALETGADVSKLLPLLKF